MANSITGNTANNATDNTNHMANDKTHKTSRKKRGTILMFTGLLLIAAALFLTLFNIYDSRRAGQEAEQVVVQISARIEQVQQEKKKEQDQQGGSAASAEVVPDYKLYPEMEMPSAKVDGSYYIGLLEIPALGRKLPIMAECTHQGLRKTPCRYTGSAYEDNMVIAGHNYLSHFAGLRSLPLGTEVCFTDIDGNVFRYTIEWIEVLQPDQVEDMVSGNWDLTLFTCTYGGQTRHAIRCLRIEG